MVQTITFYFDATLKWSSKPKYDLEQNLQSPTALTPTT